jgi:hypothetical protein
MTMQLIETKTLGTAAASIEFTSIPQDGTDLVLLCSLRTTRVTNPSFVRPFINGITNNQTVRRLFGDGASVSSTVENNNWGLIVPGASQTSNTFANTLLYIPNYAGSANKSFAVDSVSENNATTAYQVITAGIWNTTAAVSSISFTDTVSDFAIGSTISLYKITKGSGGATVS